MNLSQEKLGAIRSEFEDLRRKYGQVDTEMKADIQKDLRSVEVMQLAHASCSPREGDVGIIEMKD